MDIFKPPYDSAQRWVPLEDRKGYTSRINITFRFYRPDFRPYPGLGPGGAKRQGTPVCRCGIPWYVVTINAPSSLTFLPQCPPRRSKRQGPRRRLRLRRSVVNRPFVAGKGRSAGDEQDDLVLAVPEFERDGFGEGLWVLSNIGFCGRREGALCMTDAC